MNRTPVRPFPAHRAPRRQRGVVLMIALIVLIALTLAGLSMVRTADTGSVISGNLSFRQSALAATDAGVEDAFNALGGIAGIIATSAEAQIPNRYYPTIPGPADYDEYGVRKVDVAGAPMTVDWNAAPTVAGMPSGYNVRYIIERMCSGVLPITDVGASCVTDGATGGGSKRAGAPAFTGAMKTNYRITVRVEGPRNTLSIAQAVVAY
jgi:hypothetical protein